MSRLPRTVRIVEVSPRDGLQNEKAIIPTKVKSQFVLDLAAAGCRDIEAGSFVSPRWVPQMADSAEVFEACRNATGRDAICAHAESGRIAASARLRRGDDCDLPRDDRDILPKKLECLRRRGDGAIRDRREGRDRGGVAVRGYVSCALHCPFEGWVPPTQVADLSRRLLDIGCYELSLCDTTGAGTPRHTAEMLNAVVPAVGAEKIAGHFHDTYGQGLANVLVALQAGVSIFDVSAGGLGGCPYSPGATGNLATEDLVYMLDGLGAETGLCLQGLIDAVDKLAPFLSRPISSPAYMAMTAQRAREAASQVD